MANSQASIVSNNITSSNANNLDESSSFMPTANSQKSKPNASFHSGNNHHKKFNNRNKQTRRENHGIMEYNVDEQANARQYASNFSEPPIDNYRTNARNNSNRPFHMQQNQYNQYNQSTYFEYFGDERFQGEQNSQYKNSRQQLHYNDVRHNYRDSNNRQNKNSNRNRNNRSTRGEINSNQMSSISSNPIISESSSELTGTFQSQKQQSQQQLKSDGYNQGTQKKSKPIVEKTRSEILSEQLRQNKCECMVCCVIIRSDKAIWSCNVCFHIFHLFCIKKWANSASAKLEETSDKWRCPGCQNVHEKVPNKYSCFCGKKTNPKEENDKRRVPGQLGCLPHSCGDVCAKPLSASAKFWSQTQSQPSGELRTGELECKHRCSQICHPGPCSQCESIVTRSCNCGKSSFQVKCSSTKAPKCDAVCGKTLNCGVHKCERVCHAGECTPCDVDVTLSCYSHARLKTVKCGFMPLTNSTFYGCEQKCDKPLECGKHRCEDVCHSGPCQPCKLTPSRLLKCPCGRVDTRQLLLQHKLIRTSCADPVLTCDNECGKILHDMYDNDQHMHTCKQKCHVGNCAPCNELVSVKCRCGKDVDIVECNNRFQLKLCNRRCQKKKSCGRHMCNEYCCNEKDHICTQVCNKQLECKQHRCENLCHKGPCQRCLVASFDERVCPCGKTIEYPPIRCGTKPPECTEKCTRPHGCDHSVTHNCHWEEQCPPCTYLTSKMCMGGHEIRHNIPCHIADVCCGLPCGKKLDLCDHKCNKTCHKGECMPIDEATGEIEACIQPCERERPHCGHACTAPCHPQKPCPDTVCQQIITVKCKCGLRTEQRVCGQRMYESATQLVFENLASEIKEMLSCRSIDINTFRSSEALKRKHELACDEECLLQERNRNLAAALDIDPNASAAAAAMATAVAKPKPIYSEFLKNFVKEDLSFVLDVEKKLEALVKECRMSGTVTNGSKRRTLNLPIMRYNERKFIHELASFYGMETLSQDPEPHRSVSVFASKEKCYVPTPLLSQSMGLKSQPSMPKALSRLNQLSNVNPIQSNFKVLKYQEVTGNDESVALASSNQYKALEDHSGSDNEELKNQAENQIDYFDMTD
jgi:transcriptional repressor NF-X1